MHAPTHPRSSVVLCRCSSHVYIGLSPAWEVLKRFFCWLASITVPPWAKGMCCLGIGLIHRSGSMSSLSTFGEGGSWWWHVQTWSRPWWNTLAQCSGQAGYLGNLRHHQCTTFKYIFRQTQVLIAKIVNKTKLTLKNGVFHAGARQWRGR